MPRRHILTERQRHALLALPTDEASLLKHYTLDEDDLVEPIGRPRRGSRGAGTFRDTSVVELCRELGIGRGILYRYVDPGGGLRENGRRLLEG